METPVAQQRATMPSGTNQVLDRRTLENGNEHLIPFLKTGMRVLDVGCGSGTITKGIIDYVGAQGEVVGIDTSAGLIEQAKDHFAPIKNLSFERVSVLDFQTDRPFDAIVSARTLQWLSDPVGALEKMKSLLKPGGLLFILDYNHEKIEWTPAPPASMTTFYHQFLAWRTDAGMNNRVGDELPAMMESIGIKSITSADACESTFGEGIDFLEDAGIWTKVAELRGPQMVEAGFITEEARLQAILDYDHWLNNEAQSMTLYLRAVSGFND